MNAETTENTFTPRQQNAEQNNNVNDSQYKFVYHLQARQNKITGYDSNITTLTKKLKTILNFGNICYHLRSVYSAFIPPIQKHKY
jgi:hypothetical protein